MSYLRQVNLKELGSDSSLPNKISTNIKKQQKVTLKALATSTSSIKKGRKKGIKKD